MMTFIANKEVVALFAEGLLRSSRSDLASITITKQGTSADSFALTVIGMSSEDIVSELGRIYLNQLMNT